MTIVQILLLLAGLAALFFAVVPVVYGTLNAGVVALAVLALACFGELLLLRRRCERQPWQVFAGRGGAGRFVQRLLAVGLSLFFVAEVFLSICMVWQGWFTRPNDATTATAIVAGGGIHGNQPSLMLQNRLQKALEYLNAHPDAVVIVTGGQGPGEQYTEAMVEAHWLLSHGITAERVFAETQSASTYQNMQYAAIMMLEMDLPPQVVIFTDGFHQLRSQHYARLFGLETTGIPSNTPWGLLPCYWIREQAAICRAYITPG